MSLIEARLGLQQRVLPAYRAAFFDALAGRCRGGLEVFAGQARRGEALGQTARLEKARLTQGRNLHLFGGSLYLCWQDGLMAWLETVQPQALVVEANPRYLRTRQAVRWMHRRGRPVIGWGLGLRPGGGLPAGVLRRGLLGSLDALLTYSPQGMEEYQQAGFPAERIFVAPNAVMPRPASPPPPRPEGYRGGRPVVLFTGRLQERKRVDLLLRACAALPGRLQPILWVVGDGPARRHLEALAGSIYPQAEFTGSLYGPELERRFGGADLFVLPGTGGLALQQAMSFGLPVISAEADGTQACLVTPGNGWIIPPGDLAALSELLQTALQDPATLRRMGRESFRIASEEVNVEAMVDAFARAVNFALGGRACTSC